MKCLLKEKKKAFSPENRNTPGFVVYFFSVESYFEKITCIDSQKSQPLNCAH